MSIDNAQSLLSGFGDAVAIVVNHSGGKDSQRMLGMLRTQFPTAKMYVVMADTGFEHVKPVSAEEFARTSAAMFGLDLHVVRNPNKTYLEMVEKRGMFPSSSTRQCTSDLKRGPIEKFIRHLDEKIIINCTGIRAAESSARAKQNPWKVNEGLSVAGRVVYNWMPIFNESLQDVLNWHWSNKVPLHPVYVPAYHIDGTAGGYLRRLSCRLCIFSTKADIRAIHQNDPDAFYAVANLEVKMDFTMRSGQSLFQIIDQVDDTDKKQYGSEEIVDVPCI